MFTHALLASLVIAGLYGAADEFHQLFVPNRDCEFWDWLADFAGTVIMVLLIRYYLSSKFSIFNRSGSVSPQKDTNLYTK